jgi:hypothetical protein
MPLPLDRDTLRKRVLREVKAQKLSYALIGAKFGISRGAVAGIVFRDRHPVAERISAPNSRSRSKIGTGYRLASYEPVKSRRQWWEQRL